tara:strand:- start:701 stop:952 length:252 start_codon:yes stop_codon:yes gene_type:complete
MKRFLLPLIAVFALPTAVHASSTWLILRYAVALRGESGVGAAIEKIQVDNLDDCELMGAKWMGSKVAKGEQRAIFAYDCLQGN